MACTSWQSTEESSETVEKCVHKNGKNPRRPPPAGDPSNWCPQTEQQLDERLYCYLRRLAQNGEDSKEEGEEGCRLHCGCLQTREARDPSSSSHLIAFRGRRRK